MKHLNAYCAGMLAGVLQATPAHTCDIAPPDRGHVRVERHYYTFGPEEEHTLAVAILHEGPLVSSYAFFCRQESNYLLKLSNGETYDLTGDLSQAQLVNILADICPTPDGLLDIKIFTRRNDPELAVIEEIDDRFYDAYLTETGMQEVLSPAIINRTGPDSCLDGIGSYARSSGFSGRCFALPS